MKQDFKIELGRKLVHFASLFIIIIYVAVGRYSHKLALLSLTFLLVLLIELEYVRLEAGRKLAIIRFLQRFRRAKEKDHIGGEVFFVIGAILCLAIFDFRIALAAILMTTFGDMTAALVGKWAGRHKMPRSEKTWEGTLAGLAVNLIIGWIFIRSSIASALWLLTGNAPHGLVLWPVVLVMGLTASITELFINKLDDNLLIPLFSGFNGQVALLIMNITVLAI